MKVEGLQSALITEKDDILDVIENALKKQQKTLKEKDILVITSKVLAVCQGRITEVDHTEYKEGDFKDLIRKEGGGEIFPTNYCYITFKEGHLIPNAGIDKSNIPKGQVVLWPTNAPEEAQRIQEVLRKKYDLQNLGVIISDSTCAPLRPGVHGISIGHYGFEGVEDCRNDKDLYGNEIRVTRKALADNLATAAAIIMGETDESIPFAIISDAPANFMNERDAKETIALEDDLFYGMYSEEFKKFAFKNHNKE
jgi:coenzyme F420-0:L-glutamate ligase